MKKSWLKYFWIRWTFFVVLGILFKFIIDVVFSVIYRNYSLIQDFNSYLFAIALVIVTLEGIYHINNLINKKLEWEKNIVKRFIIQISINLIYAILFINILRIAISYFFFDKIFIRLLDEIIYLIIALFSVVVITSVDFGRFLIEKWKMSLVELERYNKDRAEFQFEMLQTQINPHFLFNSLNTLSSLIYENKDQAAEFTRELSDVYRYVLDSRKNEVVTIKEEIEFLKSFLYLYKLRFDKKLSVNLAIDDSIYSFFIPPLTLQMLIENAVKHNVTSLKKPLWIKIYYDEIYIIVENKLELKTSQSQSSQVGLSNIKNRFRYLTNSEVVIEKDAEIFKVKIPIIKEYEGINN